MRKVVHSVLVLAVIAPFLSTTTRADPPAKSDGYAPGQRFKYEIDASGRQIVLGSFVEGGIGEEKYDSHATLRIEVIETNASSTTLRWTYDRLAIEFESPVDPRRFDSDQPIARLEKLERQSDSHA